MAKARGIDLERIREILSKTKIVPRKINDELGRSFVAYAMEVNVNRAIPDVCDGLKPVQRRILYAMNEINNTHDKAYKKCARTVGEVLGKYHPHGDSSIYDALVRMAQDFTMRMPLIDGHGNFGSVDNDPAAASRYTEARLAKVASILLQDLEKDTVNFCPNFDDTETQPVVLPAGFPNLLVNGSDGIAVALATHIPPHNLGDVIDATCALIDNPESEIEDLIKIVRCPDYPTGGVILGHNAILKAYKTGHGGIIIRSKYEIEETDTKTRIIVTEIPYNVCKEDLIGDVRTLMKDKKIEGIAYINDESDRFGMRIVIDVKRDAQANVVINSLFKQTKFQISTGILMVALDKGVPKQMNLKEILQCYIAHRFQVVTRRTEFQLRKALEKAHILEGLVIALDNLDEVIRIIKTSKDTPDARERLMQTFGLSEKQSNAILDMRLARLTSLEATKIRAELRELEIAIADWRDILAKPERVYVIVKTELNEVKTSFPSPRRSEPVYGEDEDIDMGDLIDKEDVVISFTAQGYVKRAAVADCKAQGRGGKGVRAHTTKDDDYVVRMFVCNSHDDVCFFSSLGRVYRIKAYNIPEASKAAKGRAIINILNLSQGEKITSLLALKNYDTGYIMMATRQGLVKKSATSEFDRINVNGKIAISLNEGDTLIETLYTTGDNEIIFATHEGKCLRTSEENIRAMGRTAAGVKSMKMLETDYIVDFSVVDASKSIVTVTENGMGKRSSLDEYRLQGRNGSGIKAGEFNEKTGKLVCLKLASVDEDIMIITDGGQSIRTAIDTIGNSEKGRATQGVWIMRTADGSKVVSCALTPKEDTEQPTDVAE